MNKAGVSFEEVKEDLMKDEEFRKEYEAERSAMGLIVKYRSNDPGTKITGFSFLFHEEPGIVSWDSETKIEADGIVTLTCYNLQLLIDERHETITKEFAENALMNGGFWFGGDKKPYSSTLEVVSAEFFAIDGYNFPVSVISRLRGKA